MSEHAVPSYEEVLVYLNERRNWGRWGPDDQRGAINLITREKTAQAARLIQSGRTVSLSRDFPKTPGPGNPEPAQHFVHIVERPNGCGVARDYYGISHHGFRSTHIDALCHLWDDQGMWGGRDPTREMRTNGSRWGGVEHWRDGIATRGVLLDVPRFRNTPFVDLDRPVHGGELEEIARAEGVQVGPGDALVVYCGLDRFQAAHPEFLPVPNVLIPRPGLHVSCLPFVRDRDVALLCWDMMDALPNEHGLLWTVHYALFKYGVALVDNCFLEPLADACAEETRYEFMLVVAPWPVVGGTGSPANPIALF